MSERSNKPESETTYFRLVRDMNGNLVPVGVARRNGRLVPQFDHDITEPPDDPEDSEKSPAYQEFEDAVFYDLTNVERRTARLAMRDGRSNSDIAEIEGVSREAVIDRLRRSVLKNQWVRLWWRRKNKINQYK